MRPPGAHQRDDASFKSNLVRHGSELEASYHMKRALPDPFGDDPFADGGDALLASVPCDTEATLRLLNAKLLAWQVREERGEARC